MAKTIGVGGVFLGLKGDDRQLRDWYEEHLRLDMSPYGTGFIEGEQEVAPGQFSVKELKSMLELFGVKKSSS